jgi:hypothetical protein
MLLTRLEIIVANISVMSREVIENRVGVEIMHMWKRQAKDRLLSNLCTKRNKSSFSRSMEA